MNTPPFFMSPPSCIPSSPTGRGLKKKLQQNSASEERIFSVFCCLASCFRPPLIVRVPSVAFYSAAVAPSYSLSCSRVKNKPRLFPLPTARCCVSVRFTGTVNLPEQKRTNTKEKMKNNKTTKHFKKGNMDFGLRLNWMKGRVAFFGLLK